MFSSRTHRTCYKSVHVTGWAEPVLDSLFCWSEILHTSNGVTDGFANEFSFDPAQPWIRCCCQRHIAQTIPSFCVRLKFKNESESGQQTCNPQMHIFCSTMGFDIPRRREAYMLR